jgi:uncharacterized membrane protein
MSTAIGYAIAAMMLNGLNDFIFKQAANRSFRTHQFIALQSAIFCSLVWLYAYFTSQIMFAVPVSWGIAAGLFMFTGFYAFALSLQAGSVSINAPVFRLNFIVTAAVAIALLAEPVTLPKLTGLSLAVAAILLLVSAPGSPTAIKADMRRSLALVILATVAVGLGSVMHKIGIREGMPAAMLLAVHSTVYLTLATMVAVRADGRLIIPRAVWPYSSAGGLVGAGAFIAFVEALARAEASVVVPISQMGLLVAALLGIVVLRESLTLRKTMGLAAAVGALWVLAGA